MTQFDALLAADEARRNAMINADLSAMNRIFDEDLLWTHSSGKTDNRSGLTDTICGGSVVYQAIENSDISVSQHGHVYIMTGTLRGEVMKEGSPKSLHNKFLAVWKQSGDSFSMLAWQSTGL